MTSNLRNLPITLWFDDPASLPGLVGGKGGNLAKLTLQGLPVPPGVTITTEAYRSTLKAPRLHDAIGTLVAGIDYANTADLEQRTGQIRQLIEATPIPEHVEQEIRAVYAQLGKKTQTARPYVAVRSSGTAEDLADASFAGLHDTYLDILGADALLDAVRRCWASMWTARAVAYRQNKGFNHFEAALAVVIQVMIESEAAGVMFTGNPLTERTDEILINSSWGLGEAVVSGVVTPDELLLSKGDLKLKRELIGTKEVTISRKVGGGTIEVETDEARRTVRSLTDEQLADLGELGRIVERHYSRVPQDIEWAVAHGKVYMLQSRPVTGANFSWDEDLELPEKFEDEENTAWEGTWAGEALTGANCPLFYSTRGWNYDRCYTNQVELYSLGEEYAQAKHFKFHKSAVYYNTKIEKAFTLYTMLPHSRNSPYCWGGLKYIEPSAHKEILNAPFDWFKYLRLVAKMQLDPHTSYLGSRKYVMNRWFLRDSWDPSKFDAAQLRRLSDDKLKHTVSHWLKEEELYCDDITMWFYNLRDGINLLAMLVDKWYDGDNPTAMLDLISGAPGETPTARENKALWSFSERVKASPKLSAAFALGELQFFSELTTFVEGQEWLADYRKFVAEHPHRGHSDRDIIWDRRGENSAVDYRAIKALMTADSADNPEALAAKTNARRTAVIEDVVDRLNRQMFGALKVHAFKAVLDYVGHFLVERDLERYSYDKNTYIMKLMLLEVGRRAYERGGLEAPRDMYFLGLHELYEVLDGVADMTLIKAKIAGRKRNFEAYDNKEWEPAPFIIAGKELDPAQADADTDSSRLRGLAQSRGVVTGIARIVKSLDKIGTIQKGEILVCNGTDPGWTPAFLIISGIVTQTGGVLSHAACLSREYGLPAVQLPGAINKIPDGATITVNGTTGEVIVVEALPIEQFIEEPAGELLRA